MIDFIKIRLDDFSGNLEKNCVRKETYPDPKTGLIYENYTLPNDNSSAKRHSLKLYRCMGENRLTVKGSVRKWYNNRNTAADLTAAAFEKMIKLLAQKLNIPFDELCRAEFTQCEIGMNVRPAIPCCEVIPMIVRYGRLSVDKAISYPRRTSYFGKSVKRLKIYDKGKEIGDRAREGENAITHKEMFDILKKKGYHFLRIEYTLSNKKAFNQNGMGHIKTIGDLINNYADLYTFWCYETSRIVLFNRIDESCEMKKAELEIAKTLNSYGFDKAQEKNAAGINKENPNKRSVSAAESAILKKILTVIRKYRSKEDYNINSFRRDITRELMRRRRADPAFDIYSGIRALWLSQPKNHDGAKKNGKEKVK